MTSWENRLREIPSIGHDGTFMSCDAIKEWCRAHGYFFVSATNASGLPEDYIISLRDDLHTVHLRKGDRAVSSEFKLLKQPYLTVVAR